MQKTLILGGMGFIGTALARHLLERGHEVTLIDNLSPQIHGDLPTVDVPDGARLLRFDVRELCDRWQVLEGVDAVFHLAAETGTAQSMYRISHYVGVNDLGTASLLEAMAKCTRRPGKVILASSRSVYGEGAYVRADAPQRMVQPPSRLRDQLQAQQWDLVDADGAVLKAVPTPESLGFAPGSVYAATKAAQELLLRSAAGALGFGCHILRLQNVYGAGQSLQNPYTGIISIFYNRARQGLGIDLYEDGHPSRDFVHVQDVVAAFTTAMEAELPSGLAINIGTGKPTSVATLAHALCRAAGLSVETHVTGKFRVGDIRHCYADIELARRLLGYQPTVALPEGLARFLSWAEHQPVHVDQSAQAAAELLRRDLGN